MWPQWGRHGGEQATNHPTASETTRAASRRASERTLPEALAARLEASMADAEPVDGVKALAAEIDAFVRRAMAQRPEAQQRRFAALIEARDAVLRAKAGERG